jgi:hypothetical protein
MTFLSGSELAALGPRLSLNRLDVADSIRHVA